MAKATPERFHPLHTWTIKVKPRARRYFWSVGIYQTYDELNRWIDHLGSRDPWADSRKCKANAKYAACVLCFKKAPAPGCFGYIVFTTQHMGGGIVAHEMTHAALRTLGYGLGRRLGRGQEEELAAMIEHLTKEFWRKWYRYAERS